MVYTEKLNTSQDAHNQSGQYQGPYVAANQVTPGAESV